MQYYANPCDDPRILLRQETQYDTLERWISHRQAWVPVRDHWEYVSLFHSEATHTKLLSEAEAEALKIVVPDMSEEFMAEYELKPKD